MQLRTLTADGRADRALPILGAACFFLSTVEFMIPKPLPFLRLGLANLPIMVSIELLSLPSFFLLVLVKILGQGLLGGTLFSYVFLFSTAGTLASALAMRALRTLPKRAVSWAGIGVVGAFASNAAQLALARAYLFGEGAWFVAPPFLALGAVTGFFLGIAANRFVAESRWYAAAIAGSLPYVPMARPAPARPETERVAGAERTRAAARLVAGGGLIALILFAPNLFVLAAAGSIALALVVADRSRVRLLPTLIMASGIVIFSLIVPHGRVLGRIGAFPITEGALLEGVKKALVIEGLVFASRWTLRYGLSLPGRLGSLVGESLALLAALSGRRGDFDPRRPIESVDGLLFSLSEGKDRA